MKNYYLYFLLIFLLDCSANNFTKTSLAQSRAQNIIISDDLAATAEVLKVKMNMKKTMKNWGIKFGEYHVVLIEVGDSDSRVNTNYFGTKSESETKDDIFFILTNKLSDSVKVEAKTNIQVKELRSYELFRDFYLGDDKLLEQSYFLTSTITTSNNRNETWVLLIEQSYGNNVNYKYEAFLRYGERIIKIMPVSSNSNGTERKLYPALGYEFFENEQSLCAVQYHSGGLLGYFKKKVWIKSELEPNIKLILSAAMTSLMVLKTPD